MGLFTDVWKSSGTGLPAVHTDLGTSDGSCGAVDSSCGGGAGSTNHTGGDPPLSAGIYSGHLVLPAASVGDRVVCVPADGAYIVIGVVGNTESGGGGSEGTGGGTSFSPGNALELKNGWVTATIRDGGFVIFEK